MSPQLFAVYIDDVIKSVQLQGGGCYMCHVCVNVILYADDVLLLSPYVEGLQQMLIVCETEINVLELNLNFRKSVCIAVVCEAVCCMEVRPGL